MILALTGDILTAIMVGNKRWSPLKDQIQQTITNIGDNKAPGVQQVSSIQN